MNQNLVKRCITLTLAVVALQVNGASIVLREQAIPTGAVVFLSDIADVAAASEDEMHNLATTPLMAAPAHGTQEFLSFAKVLELLESRGVDMSGLTFAGARTVKVGKAIATQIPHVTEPVRQLAAGQREQAVVDAIVTHLGKTTRHHDWQVELSLGAAELRDLGKLGVDLTASAGRSPWIGAQKFRVTGTSDAEPVFVLAKVARLNSVVVATRRIEQGSLIGATDVEMRSEPNVPTTAVHALELVIGKEATRVIEADAILQASQTRSPMLVQRGETVKVSARTGGITVSTFAIVQQNGALGDLVQVQTLDKKDRFAARVSGWKQLEVLPTGVTTADYAALKHSETQKR
jgi:flagella basal body P-ring formation protein FlgA